MRRITGRSWLLAFGFGLMRAVCARRFIRAHFAAPRTVDAIDLLNSKGGAERGRLALRP